MEGHVVSASRRTDIPGLHARWLLNRIRTGWCEWVHPYTASVSRVSLAPADVLAFVFWTRWPGPLLPHLAALRESGYPMLFQLTVNGYGPPLESHNPSPERVLASAEEIARRLGPAALLWRYDPIVLGPGLSFADHVRRFRGLASRFDGITRRCTISFVDFYGKTERNLARLEPRTGRLDRPAAGRKRALARELAGIAAQHGMELLSCCDDSLAGDGVGKSRCVDPDAIGAVRGGASPALAAAPTRRDCGCVRSVDIGAYDTCAFGCAYCYAVGRRSTALRRLREADPDDSLLWRPPSLRPPGPGRDPALPSGSAGTRPAPAGA